MPPTRRRSKQTVYVFATIGSGVDVRVSSIQGAGNGLYTTRSYKRNQIITEYCGPLIDYQEARERRGRQQDSHIRCLSYGTQCIDGLKQPEQGQGGASFANDARDTHLNNSRFYSKWDNRVARYRVYLKATRDLPAGTEVFVSYGRVYWRCRD